MDRLFRKTNIASEKTPVIVLIFFAVLFLTGCITGTLFACALDESSRLFADLQYSFRVIEPERIGFFRFAVSEVLVYAGLLILGFTVFGVAVIPAVSFAKGFSFAFTFSAFVRLLAGQDIKWTVFLFVSDAFLMIPALFSAMDLSFTMSLRLARSLGGTPHGRIRLRIAVITLVLCVCSVIISSALKIIFFPHIISASIL